MTQAGALPFRKMNGLGNDFVVLDGRVRAVSMDDARARAIADRKTGIGCDQIIILQKSDIADVRMLVWNSGGGQVESCGNAARCIADMLFDENKSTSATIDTLGGFLVARKTGDRLVTIDNGVPRFDWKDIPLSEPFHDTRHIEL
ncbi:MAG: diaminopimelate epimerase, partial [Aestuariivirga sp.]|nr:diaminopimelate epimerase [Aestuariivirga sp.]